MVLVSRAPVPGGSERISLRALCRLPGQACSAGSACSRETLCNTRDSRALGAAKQLGPWEGSPCVFWGVLVHEEKTLSEGGKTKQKMTRKRMSKHTWWQSSKPRGISRGSYKVSGYHPLPSLGIHEQGTVKRKRLCLNPTRLSHPPCWLGSYKAFFIHSEGLFKA